MYLHFMGFCSPYSMHCSRLVFYVFIAELLGFFIGVSEEKGSEDKEERRLE